MEKLNFANFDYTVFDKYISQNELSEYVRQTVQKDLQVLEEMYTSSTHLQKIPLLEVIAHIDELGLRDNYFESANRVFSLNYFMESLSKKPTAPSSELHDFLETQFETLSNLYVALETALLQQKDEKYLVVYVDDDEFINIQYGEDGIGDYLVKGKVIMAINIDEEFLKILNIDKQKYIAYVWEHLNWNKIYVGLKCNYCDGC